MEAHHRLRVRYCETDRMGVTHHGSYIDWFEEARTEWFRSRGYSYREMEDAGIFLQVVGVEVRYLNPTTFDDEIEIVVSVAERKRVSITLEYEVRLLPDRVVAATAVTKLACVGSDKKLRRLPDGF